MIRRIGSNLEFFKTLSFMPGLNILLANKSEGASDLQSRNGAGKTSFVEIVHFLCGARAETKGIFRSDALKDVTFEMTVDIDGNEIEVCRSGAKPNELLVSRPADYWPIPPRFNEDTNLYELTNTEWCQTLGALWFGLEASPDSSAKFQPTFRSQFPYFARRQSLGAFQVPKQHSNKQQIWNWQVAISHMIGLDWHISQDMEMLREKARMTKNLNRAAQKGYLGPHFERTADLQTQLTIRLARVRHFRQQLDEFQVIPEYRTLEAEANDITNKISQLVEENFTDQSIINDIDSALMEEKAPEYSHLIKLYGEVNIIIPDLIKNKLKAVEHFHSTIVENRRSHLNAELESARERIGKREAEQQKLDQRRSQIMGILQSGGALENHTLMREELGRLEAEVKTIRQRLEAAEQLENSKANINAERNRLAQELRDDIHERRELMDEAILCFEELSQGLYEKAGSLTIDAGNNGPDFQVKIDGERSKGITNMQIFCFDLMLVELSAKQRRSPGFLIHDSHLFDGVDERQIANALQIAAKRAESIGFQYIVTMNSDAVPSDDCFDAGFDLNKYVMPTTLTDAVDDGGLFGIRF